MFSMMKFFIKKTASFLAKDKFGNEYYVSRFRKDYLGRNKRFVLYKGKNEPSKVSAGWHAWLHYMVDRVPMETIATHVPNLTGTKHAHSPLVHKLEETNTYKRWSPNNKQEGI